MSTSPRKKHRFSISIVAHAIWLYFRFNLSLREVEEMMLERGVVAAIRFCLMLPLTSASGQQVLWLFPANERNAIAVLQEN